MKKLLLIALGLTLAIGIFGCGDDDSSNPTTKTPGDANDQTFIAIQNSIEESLLPGMLGSLNEGISLLDFDGGPIAKVNDTSYYDFNEQTFWWRFVDQSTEEGEGYYYGYSEIDSFRFEEGSQYQQYPDSGTTTGLDTRQHMDYESYSETDSSETHADISYHYTGLTGDIMTITGSTDVGFGFAMDSLTYDYSYDGTFDDVTIPIANIDPESDDNHPTGGGMTMSVNYDILSLNPNYPSGSYDWSLMLTFSETGYHARVESGENYWEWDGTWDESMRANSRFWPTQRKAQM